MKMIIVKTLRWCVLSGAISLLPACTFHQSSVTVQPVGPEPGVQLNNENVGYLVVYSAWGLVNENEAPVDHHSRYTIISEDGKTSRVIINHVDRFDEGPIPVALSAGTYRVIAHSAHFGRVILPVNIEAQRTTSVYLDGQKRQIFAADQQKNLVKLPNGQVVGWAANLPTK
jgi:hypothetical protein